MVIKTKNILKMLRHRYPFFFVDKIIEFEKNKRIVGVKNFTYNEYFFRGHFPKEPIVPGVIIIEALAQTCAVFSSLNRNITSDNNTIIPAESFLCASNIRFKKTVEPGDTVLLEIAYEWQKGPASCFKVKAIDSESGKIVAIGSLKSKIID